MLHTLLEKGGDITKIKAKTAVVSPFSFIILFRYEAIWYYIIIGLYNIECYMFFWYLAYLNSF